MELVPGAYVSLRDSNKGAGGSLNCFMELESVFPISSTRAAANQKTTIALSCARFSMRMGVSAASESES